MTAGLDERRPDHTRPTIAFIVLAVTAAAVMTAGMTGNQPETPIAADRPIRGAPDLPAQAAPPPAPGPAAFPEFSMADVVTIAAAEVEPAPPPKRSKRQTADSGAVPVGSSGGSGTTTPGGRTGSAGGSGSGATSGSRSGSSGSGTKSTSGGSTSGGSGSGGTTDAGPGRSTTGQGKARGQKDTGPGRGGRTEKPGRTTGRTNARR